MNGLKHFLLALKPTKLELLKITEAQNTNISEMLLVYKK